VTEGNGTYLSKTVIAHHTGHPWTPLVGDAHPTGASFLSKCHSCPARHFLFIFIFFEYRNLFYSMIPPSTATASLSG
jgi:hypothetical protein